MADRIQLLREQHAAAVAEADRLLSVEDFGAEQEQLAEQKLAEVEALQKRISLEDRRNASAAFAQRPNGEPPRLALAKPDENDDGAEHVSRIGYHSHFGHRTQESKYFADDSLAHAAGLWTLGYLLGGDKLTPKQRKAKEWCMSAEGQDMLLTQIAGDDAKGGLFVPNIMEAAIAKLRLQYGVIRGAARVVPMGSDNVSWPRPLTGAQVFPLAEVPDDTPKSTLTTSLVTLRSTDWGTKFLWSRDLDEDAVISIADMAVSDLAYRFSKSEDEVCFNGAGTSASNGIWGIFNKLQDPAYANSVYTAAVAGHSSFATLTMDDWTSIVGKLPAFPGIQPKWYMTKAAFYAGPAALIYAAGGNTKDDIAGGTGTQFLGYPVVFTEVLNKTLTAQPNAYGCLFGDLSLACTFGSRRGLTAETNPYKYMEQRLMLLVATQRYGFAAHDLLDEAGGCGPVVIQRFSSS